MKYLQSLLCVFCLIITSGCGGDASKDERVEALNDNELSSCQGFISPSINIFVKDSLNESTVIDSAIVQIFSVSENNSLTDNAFYIAEDDGLSNSETGAYWTLLNLDELSFSVDIVATAEGYHSFVTKLIPFNLNTACGAENTINYTVYLCPVGTACI